MVEVKVFDERTSKTLGRRGAMPETGSEITTSQDIAALLQSALTTAYAKKGFDTRGVKGVTPVKIRVDLREFSYYTSTGFWSGGVHTKAAAKVSVNGSEFENMYLAENEKRILIVPGASENEVLLNKALNFLIEKIVNDEDLTAAILKQQQTESGLGQ